MQTNLKTGVLLFSIFKMHSKTHKTYVDPKQYVGIMDGYQM